MPSMSSNGGNVIIFNTDMEVIFKIYCREVVLIETSFTKHQRQSQPCTNQIDSVINNLLKILGKG